MVESLNPSKGTVSMGNITVRDPFYDMRSVMRHAFEESFFRRASSGNLSAVLSRRSGDSSRALALDVYEDDGVLHVEAPPAGFIKGDVKVTLEKGTLTIRAEHETIAERDSDDSEPEGTDDSSTEGRRYFLRERRSGSVPRSLLIGDPWDADTVNGTLENGVLSLTIAKSVEAQPRTVEIS